MTIKIDDEERKAFRLYKTLILTVTTCKEMIMIA